MQTPQGWTLSLDGTTFPEDSWGMLLPQLKQLLKRWAFLSAAEHGVIKPDELLLTTRRQVKQIAMFLGTSTSLQVKLTVDHEQSCVLCYRYNADKVSKIHDQCCFMISY
jgi:hypothetical protein